MKLTVANKKNLVKSIRYASEYAVLNELLNQMVHVYEVVPDTVHDDGIKAALTLTAGAQAGVTAGISNPDVPRNITIQGTKAGPALTGDVKIYGTDAAGAAITETLALSDDASVPGVLAFKTVSKIDFPARATEGDTVKVGFGDLIGFPEVIPGNTVLFANVDGARDTAPTVAFGSHVHDCTFDTNIASDGAKVMTLFYFA